MFSKSLQVHAVQLWLMRSYFRPTSLFDLSVIAVNQADLINMQQVEVHAHAADIQGEKKSAVFFFQFESNFFVFVLFKSNFYN